MKKFTVLILGVSTLFICLGGIAKQLQAVLKFDERLLTALGGGEEKERIPVTKPRILVRHSNEAIIPGETKERMPAGEVTIRQTLPSPPSPPPPAEGAAEPRVFSLERLEFSRRPSDVPLETGVVLPRVAVGENVIIVKRPAEERVKE